MHRLLLFLILLFLQVYEYAPNVATNNLNNFISGLNNFPGFVPVQEVLPPSRPAPNVEYVPAPCCYTNSGVCAGNPNISTSIPCRQANCLSICQ